VDHDDWRVTISFPGSTQAQRAKGLLARSKVAEDTSRQLGICIALGADGSQVFLYTGTELAVCEAESIARDALARNHLQPEFAIQRWNPLEGLWEEPDVPLPRTKAERQVEHQRLLDDETAESAGAGVPVLEVRAEFPSHHEAAALARRLQAEGRAVVRRWKLLVVGAGNEDDAAGVASQIGSQAPSGTTVRVEQAVVYLPFVGLTEHEEAGVDNGHDRK
jgi:hypothetical protein